MQEEFKMLTMPKLMNEVVTCDIGKVINLVDDIMYSEDGSFSPYNLVNLSNSNLSKMLFKHLDIAYLENISFIESIRIRKAIINRLFKPSWPIEIIEVNSLCFIMDESEFDALTVEQICSQYPKLDIDIVAEFKEHNLFKAMELGYDGNIAQASNVHGSYQKFCRDLESHNAFLTVLGIEGTKKEQCLQIMELDDKTLFNALYNHHQVYLDVNNVTKQLKMQTIKLDLVAEIMAICPLIKLLRGEKFKITKQVKELLDDEQLSISLGDFLKFARAQGFLDSEADEIWEHKIYTMNVAFQIINRAMVSDDFKTIRACKKLLE